MVNDMRNPFGAFLSVLKNNNKKGMTLVYTLIVVAIVVIIGTALAALAVMSIRLSVLNHAQDKAFYLSDAAMEETLAQLESLSHKAQVYATEHTKDTNSYYNEAKWQAFLEKLNGDLSEGKITSDEASKRLSAATKAEFEKNYYYYLFDKPSGSAWLSQDYKLLDNGTSYIDVPTTTYNQSGFSDRLFKALEEISFDPSKQESFKETGKPTMAVSADIEDNLIVLNLKSNGQFNQYKKPISLEVAMAPPDYQQVIRQQNTTVTLHDNLINQYALAARGDLLVTEGTRNTIDGDTYVYGTFPEKSNYRITEQGGVLLGYRPSSNILKNKIGDYEPSLSNKGADVNFNGNLYARSDIKLFNESNLNVTGDIFANALSFDESSKSADAVIGKNLYLYEDLYLAGDHPNLVVGNSIKEGNGLIWGVMEHQPKGIDNTNRSDMSASIIIDSDAKTPRITANSAYIAGVAYFNVYRDEVSAETGKAERKYYQTGESFTTNHNFYFYDTKATGNTELTTSVVTYYDEDGNEYYLYEALNADGKIVSNVQYKTDVFFNGSLKNPATISQADRSIFNIRSIDLDSEEDVLGLEKNYALGVMIANSKVIDPYPNFGSSQKPKSEYADEATFKSLRRIVLNALDLKTGLLSTRDFKKDRNQDPNDATASKLGMFLNFPSQAIQRTLDPKSIVIVNDDENVNVYVNIPESLANTIKVTEPNSIFLIENGDTFLNMNGIIVSRGNVIVYNDNTSKGFTYNGTIISDKSIVLRGTGEKHFIHNQDVINHLIAKDSLLQSVFYANSGKSVRILEVNGSPSTSDNASLSIGMTDNDHVVSVNVESMPVTDGMVKPKTEYSFQIRRWKLGD